MQVQAGQPYDTVVAETKWLAQRRKHLQRLSPVVKAHRERALIGRKHPVIDFLFEYYHFKPAKLLDWSPGIGVILAGDKSTDYLSKKFFCKSDLGVYVDPSCFPKKRCVGLKWIINLLEVTRQRKPSFGCFGLHEWCMIYEKSDIRHAQLPLRLAHSQIKQMVEQTPVKCSHYDAFRFYSQSAKKFNRHQLTRVDMTLHEQPGCLHSNMDLYRWSYKFHPWLASDLIAEAFMLALEIRETDMRASPYDVSDYTSLPAIKIETKSGKEHYAHLQREYYRKAQVLRQRLITQLKILEARVCNDAA